MRIYSKIEVQMTNTIGEYLLVSSTWENYSGPLALCKGDKTAKASEIAQANFTNTLQNAFAIQFGKQGAITDFLTSKLKPIIEAGGVGYGREALTAMRTGATDQLSTAYQNAQKTLQNKEFSRGGEDLPSGVNAQLDAELLNSEASDKATAQNNITLQNENQKQQTYWAALNGLSGNAATVNPLGYASSANQGSEAVAGLSQAVTASSQSQLLGALGGIAGGAGSALGGYFGKH
jgi:hypothetical protein